MKPITFTLPAFGSLIAGQGGILAAIMRGAVVDGVEQPPYALLVSPLAADEATAKWGNYGKEIAGTASRIDGQANTASMIEADCPAALKARECTDGGHNDWHLASLGEFNAAAANVPEHFHPKGMYWTSTQGSRGGAFVQGFEYGGSAWGNEVLRVSGSCFPRDST